jgi:hypothetical protein
MIELYRHADRNVLRKLRLPTSKLQAIVFHTMQQWREDHMGVSQTSFHVSEMSIEMVKAVAKAKYGEPL